MTKRFLSVLLLSGALFAPTVIRAEDHETNITIKRYYDRDHKDYHQWNRDEDRSYRLYLQENHRSYRDFNKLKRNDQEQYWSWRHDHNDADRRDDHQRDRK